MHPLAPLLSPRSVAIVGISPTRTQARNALANLAEGGYRGATYLVHPTLDRFEDAPVYRGLDALPEVPECVVLALSAEKSVEQLDLAGRLGVKAAIMFASGFAESDEAGRRREALLAETARRHGMQLCGPNCMGLVDRRSGFSAFIGAWPAFGRVGGVDVLSHSGAGCVVLGNAGRFGIGRLISLGNGAALDMPECLDVLADDPATRIAALVIETLRDPAAFRRACDKMRRAGKSIVALKSGRSAKGAAATAAHTGAIAGSHAAYTAFFADCGVITVGDLDELIEVVALLDQLRTWPEGEGVAVIGTSGGEMTMACDLAEELGLRLADLGDETKRRIEREMPSFAYASNPLDARTFAPEAYEKLVLAIASDPGVSLVAVSQDSSHTLSERQALHYLGVCEALKAAQPKLHKPLVFYNNTQAEIAPMLAAPLREAGIPMLRGARNALLAIGKLASSAAAPGHVAVEPSGLRRDPRWVQRLRSPAPLTEREAKDFLAACGIASPDQRLANDAAQAALHAEAIGFPVALKIESPDIAHKTEAGGVALNLASARAVSEAFERMMKSVRRSHARAAIHGAVVQKMMPPGIEVLVGLSRQAPFGLVLTLGWGGVQVELMNDGQLLLLPCTRARIAECLARTRVSKLLRGFRGAAPADQAALVDLAARLGDVAASYGDLIEAIDINPVSVQPEGRGVYVLDALVETRAQHGLAPLAPFPGAAP